jgi:hypothetical protein
LAAPYSSFPADTIDDKSLIDAGFVRAPISTDMAAKWRKHRQSQLATGSRINSTRRGRRTMMRTTVTASVLMFGLPFLLLATCYADLMVEMPVLLNPIGGKMRLAPNSVFAVFRVPFMNLTHGLMATVRISRTGDLEGVRRQASYSGIFLTLLFTIALKSDFEAMAIRGLAWSFGPVMPSLTGATVVTVVVGLALAFVHSRGVSGRLRPG